MYGKESVANRLRISMGYRSYIPPNIGRMRISMGYT